MVRRILNWQVALVVVFCVGGYLAYDRWFSPTQIALVNYSGFQVARFDKANNCGQIVVSELGSDQLDQAEDFDLTLIFGRGFALDPDELRALKGSIDDGATVLVEAATNPNFDLTNVRQPYSDHINAFLSNGGTTNYRNLLRTVRHDLSEKTWGCEPPGELVAIDSDVLFHIDESQLFTEVEDYVEYYRGLPVFNEGGLKIALMTSVPGPFNANREHLDALIVGLEARGLQVFPIASRTRRLELLQAIDPDAVVMMPHGRFHLGRGEDAIRWLRSKQIPLLAPISVFDAYDDWLNDPQGYSGALLTMNVVLPELDGAVAPYAINAQFPDENGYLIFEAIPQRLERFLDLLDGFLALKHKDNSDKKIGIVYFRGPGKNALVAGGMEVAPSLFDTLHSLKREGYDLGDLPDEFETFNAQLNRQGVILAPFAAGSIDAFMQDGNPAFVPGETYRSWCEQLGEVPCGAMSSAYGPGPGEYMVTQEQELAIARLQYGNVVVMPQPLPGIGEDTFKLVHGTDKAPPHNYAAAYLWLRHAFGADAVMHYGTHGSLEFTPAKQVALSQNDWADALLGGIPHFYVYTMSNVGEAIIAKRRSYATILNHLTPPFQEAGLYSEWKALADKVAEYRLLNDGAVRNQVQAQITGLLLEDQLFQDLSLTRENVEAPADFEASVLTPLARWLETLGQAKITEGLYTLGQAYASEQAQRTVRLMSVDALAQAALDIRQVVDPASAPAEVLPAMRKDAERWIQRRLDGEDAQRLLQEISPPGIAERVARWRAGNPELNEMDIIRGFVAMAGSGGRTSPASGRDAYAVDELMTLTAEAVADPENRAFVEGLKGQQSFEHVSRALDPESAKTARVLAKVIPAIGESLAMLEKPKVRRLVEAMQSPEAREQVFGWLEGGALEARVRLAQQERVSALAIEASAALPAIVQSLSVSPENWQEIQAVYDRFVGFRDRFAQEPGLIELLADDLRVEHDMSVGEFSDALQAGVKTQESALARAMERERALSQAYERLSETLEHLERAEQHLLSGSELERVAMAQALAGGYIEPASGGDPIVNPQALPTGRNMYAIDAEKTPTEAAWKVGQQMAQALLQNHLADTGAYPQKVSFTLWPNSFIQSQGATVAEILYLLGVEPVRDAFGRVQTLRLIPSEQLGRPRVDVVLQSAGQFRDLAASRLALVEKAVLMASEAGGGEDGQNFVSKGVRDAEKYLLEQGVPPLRARMLASKRSFGGLNGAYGTAIMGMVEGSTRWKNGDDIARQYLTNMGANYGATEGWGEYEPHLFAAALLNTEVVIQPRSSNTWGALSLDHVYEFMGGLNNAVRHVTGSEPAAYFNDFRDPTRAQVTSFHETVWAEMRTTLLNPKYIGSLQEGSSSSAETFAETFRNSFGWNVMKTDGLNDQFWDSLYDVYLEDRHELDLRAFFERENPYALQEMSGVMLETARRGYWNASDEQLQALAVLHAELVRDHEMGGGDFSGGNAELARYLAERLPPALKQQYDDALTQVRGDTVGEQSVVLEKQSNERQQVEEPRDSDASERKPSDSAPQAGEPSQPSPVWWLLALLLLIPVVWFWRRARV